MTFMSSMVEDLIGNEQVMMAIAKAQGKEYLPTIDQWAKDNGIELVEEGYEEGTLLASEDDEESDY